MNVVEIILKELGIRFSHTFVENVFLNAPDSDNMYGIKRALSRYGVKSVGIHFDDKEEAGVTFPCILHLENNFVVGIDLDEDSIRYHDGKEFKEEDMSQFNKKWTGNALLVTDTQNSQEPDLFKNWITDLYGIVVRYFFIVVLVGLGVLTILRDGMLNPVSVNVFFDLLGVMTCFLLFQKQLFRQTDFVDKVCSILQKDGCGSILESEEAKLFGLVSWTEIGFAYFSSRILYQILDEHSLPLLQLIGWAAMPYGIWSIWYQVFKAKHWCTLCVTVQAIVWTTGIYNIFVWQELYLSVADIITFTVCFTTVFLIIRILSDLYSIREKHDNVNKEFLSFKFQDNILGTALQESKKVEVAEDDSSIFYGNKSAKVTLTVLTNPHCSPCARMHKRLIQLVTQNSNIRIQYIYSSFSKELDGSCLFLIAVYQQKPLAEAVKILEEWYRYGRLNAETFIEKYNVNLDEGKVLEEYAKHIRWKEKNGIQATPTIICSGHQLPSNYSVEDLIYLDI